MGKWYIEISSYGASFFVGIICVLMPPPFDNAMFVLFIIAFLVIIVVGHKAAFRNSRLGILAFYIKPIKTATAKLNESEKIALRSSLILMFGLLIGIVLKVRI